MKPKKYYQQLNQVDQQQYDSADDILWSYDFKNDSIFHDVTFWDLLDYPGNHAVFVENNAWKKVIHPEDYSLFMDSLSSCISNNKKKIKLYTRYQTCFGQWKWFLVRGQIVSLDVSGNPLLIAGNYVDVSDFWDFSFENICPDLYCNIPRSNFRYSQKLVEKTLHDQLRSNNKIQLYNGGESVSSVLIENIGRMANSILQNDLANRREIKSLFCEDQNDIYKIADTIVQVTWVATNKAQFDYVNRQWSDFTGFTLDDSRGHKWHSAIHPEDIEITMLLTNESFLQGSYVEIENRIKRNDGEYIWHLSRSYPVYDKNGKVIKWIGTAIDIHTQKQIEHAIQNAREFSESIVDTIHEPLLVIDEQLRIKSANSSFFTKFNTSFDLIYNKEINEILECRFNAPSLISQLKEIIPNKTAIDNYNLSYSDADDKEFIFNLNANQVVQKTSKPPLILVAFLDLTKQKRSEEEIRRTLAEKDILLSEVHHRVKNNLQIVSSLLNLQMKYIKNEEDRKLLKNCQNRVYSMALVHEQLYTSEELSSLDFHIYVKKLISELYSSYFALQKEIFFTVEINSIRFDIDIVIPLGMVINELVSNAIKYAFLERSTGTISIKLEWEENKYQLTVKDDGCGLPKGFNITKNGSLGMKLINALVMQINGIVDYTFNQGSVFTINFAV